MEAPVEIRYAGVIIGRAQEVRSAEGEDSFFLPGKEPMPVGTVLHLRSRQHETPARVIRAVESPDASICGMQVRLIGEGEEVAPDWIPEPLPVKPKASAPASVRPETPTPAVEVDVARMQAETAKTTPNPTGESAAIPEAVPTTVGSSLTGALEKAARSASAETSQAATPEEAPPKAGASAKAEAEAPSAASSEDLDIIITNTPPPVSVESLMAVTEPLPAPAESAPAAPANDAQGAAATSESTEENGEEGAASGEEMPTARPIAGSSGRRKTKRRRYQQRA